MKKIYTLVACIAIACNSLFAQLNDVVSFNVNQLKFTTVGNYKQVALTDVHLQMKEGHQATILRCNNE